MQYRRHGADCCGAGHISGFDNATPDDLDRCIGEHERSWDGTNRMIEVILSERQITTGRMPAGRTGQDFANRITQATRDAGGWAQVLSERGFKFVRRFRNSNSGQNCYVFHRIPEELSLTDNLPFNWPGEAPNGGRAGVVEAPARNPVNNERANFLSLGHGGTAINARVQYFNPRGARHGQTGVVVDRHGHVGELEVRFNADGARERYSVTSFRPAPPPVGGGRGEPQPAPVPPAPVIMATEWFAVFGDGRERGVFRTQAELREAYPRVRRCRQRQIWNNGTFNFLPIQNIER